MNKTITDYFPESNSGKEQWDNVMALAKSMHASLRYSLKKVISYNALLELELESNPTGKIYIEESNDALKKSMRIIDYLNKFSKIRSRVLESIDLNVFINAIIKRLNKTDKFNIKTQSTGVSEGNFIQGNLFLLQQLFFDLPYVISGNTPNIPTDLYIHVETIERDDDFFKKRKSYLSAGEYSRITIDKENRLSEFDNFIAIFEKLESNPDICYSDRMLFLYGAVLEHGGDMFCMKNVTDSVICSLLFPLRRNQISMYSDKYLGEKELKGSETILLVDDEDIIWDVVIDMLQNMGYTVILAANGRDCVDIYENNPGQVDLVLLDMVMPEMNGREAFFKLKSIDSAVKVLLSSGYVNEEDARDVLNAGAAGFLQKPYRMINLAQKIRQILNH